MTAVTTGERLFLRATSPHAGDRISETDALKEAQLLSFFLALTADERHERFGEAITDEAIRAWRAGLAASRYCAVGRQRDGMLIAVVELFGQTSGWRHAELALCGSRLAEDRSLLVTLVRSALFAAETLGASVVTMRNACPANHILELAHDLGGHFDRFEKTLSFLSPASVAWPIWLFQRPAGPSAPDRSLGA